MENPEPKREHRELEKLAGHFSGTERMHASSWNDAEKKGRAITDARVALDGFAVVQDYEQKLDDGTYFAGHGVFRYDTASDTYELHWFDSDGGPERIFRGGMADNMLVLTARAGEAWQRLTYDFQLEGGYRFRLETSEDGNDWQLALEGDNFADGGQPAGARKAAATTAGKTSSGGKAVAKTAGMKKAAKKKTMAKKAAAKKPTVKRTTAGKATARKAAPRKAAAGKASSKKAVPKKAASRKAAPKKAAARKKTAKKPVAKKKAGGGRAATAKPARRATAKAGAKPRVAAIEKSRRQGSASPKTGARKAASQTGASVRGAAAQTSGKGAARKGPPLQALKKTSTRTGRHKTAARGARGT
ncbi:MAG TPA: DUF1579 family protein [Gammaproteobacteria bacterium]